MYARLAQLRKLEGPNYQHYRRPQESTSFRCGDFVVARNKIGNNNYLFDVELLQHFLQLRKLARAARKSFAAGDAYFASI